MEMAQFLQFLFLTGQTNSVIVYCVTKQWTWLGDGVWSWRLLVPWSILLLFPFSKQTVSFSPPLQMEVVNTFKSGTSFQGALRRQSSTTSQHQDVTNISSPSQVSLSNALSSPTSTSAAATAGRECEFLMLRSTEMPTTQQQLFQLFLHIIY